MCTKFYFPKAGGAAQLEQSMTFRELSVVANTSIKLVNGIARCLKCLFRKLFDLVQEVVIPRHSAGQSLPKGFDNGIAL
jgi:hypothetical protein